MNSHHAKRLTLGTLIKSVVSTDTMMIIGCWRRSDNGGVINYIGLDPRSTDSHAGYLCLPCGNKSGYRYMMFGNDDIDVIC